jgi:hypothetical protein
MSEHSSCVIFPRNGGARHLVALGGRASAEFLIEAVRQGDDFASLLDRLQRDQQYGPAFLRAVGAGRFPRRPLRLVPPQ